MVDRASHGPGRRHRRRHHDPDHHAGRDAGTDRRRGADLRDPPDPSLAHLAAAPGVVLAGQTAPAVGRRRHLPRAGGARLRRPQRGQARVRPRPQPARRHAADVASGGRIGPARRLRGRRDRTLPQDGGPPGRGLPRPARPVPAGHGPTGLGRGGRSREPRRGGPAGCGLAARGEGAARGAHRQLVAGADAVGSRGAARGLCDRRRRGRGRSGLGAASRQARIDRGPGLRPGGTRLCGQAAQLGPRVARPGGACAVPGRPIRCRRSPPWRWRRRIIRSTA